MTEEKVFTWEEVSESFGEYEATVRTLMTCNTSVVTEVLKKEDPQTVAVLLSLLYREWAERVVTGLPSDLQKDVLLCMGNLEMAYRRIREEIEASKDAVLKQVVFRFEDLITLDDHAVRLLVEAMSPQDAILALKGASDLVREKVFRSMPESVSKKMQEDLGATGLVRISDVEWAQITIALMLGKLTEEGTIECKRSGTE